MGVGWRRKSIARVQGLIAPEILITKAELRSRDPDALPDAVIQFCNWCINEAQLVRGEVQPDAWLIYYTSFYIGQVNNGDHGQFASNSKMRREILDDIEAGIDKLALKDLQVIFRRFRNALDGDSGLTTTVIQGAGFGEIPKVIEELDRAFYASSDPGRFSHQATNWLRNAPTVTAFTPRALRELQKTILARNLLLERRRAFANYRSLGAQLGHVAKRFWDRTGLQRPGETTLDQLRRRVAADRPQAWQVGDAQAALISRVYPAVLDGDNERINQIMAEFRELHTRYQLAASDRWPDHIRMYASKLLYAGEQLGRPDLLEQAADAFGQTIATGSVYAYDPGYDWRSLGRSLVQLARINESPMPDIREAIDAFANSLTIDAARPSSRASCR